MGTAPPSAPPGTCKAPAKVDTSDYNPRTGLDADPDGKVVDVQTDTAIPKVGKYMMDMLVTALACDITAVATLQWSDTEAKHTFPWLGLTEHHHFYQHDGGFKPNECEQIGIWYSQQHLYLLQQMAAVDMGGHTLLDESVVFFGSEIQEPPTHLRQHAVPARRRRRGCGPAAGSRTAPVPQQSARLDPQSVRRSETGVRRPEVLHRTPSQHRVTSAPALAEDLHDS